MSEYQYYEFQAVDRPLDGEARAALRAISSRARITSTSFTNHYEWGDLKADPGHLVERYFDLFVYTANWSARRFAMRLPARLIDLAALEPFRLDEDFVTIRTAGEHVIVDIGINETDDIDPEDDGSSWLAALAPLRADVLKGDLRLFGVLWLLQVQYDWLRDEAIEPLPGIAPLSGALETFAEFIGLDQDLLDAAAESDATAPADPSPAEVAAALGSLTEAERTAFLVRLHSADEPNLAAELRRRVREMTGSAASAGQGSRTVGMLRAAAQRIAAARSRRDAELAAAEQRRREAEEARAKAAHLVALSRRGEAAWREVEALVDQRNSSGYDKATALLVDLRDLAAGNGGDADYARRLDGIRARHQQKGRFMERLTAAGLDRSSGQVLRLE